MNEDKAFADACKLEARFLEIPAASFFGHQPFNLAWVNQNRQRIASPLLTALLNARSYSPSRVRPWLFCPSGIGGHVDHVAVRSLVNENYNLLSAHYRIGFYEDFHYASVPVVRTNGINLLRKEIRYGQLYRYVFSLGDYLSKKLSLIEIYSSQFLSAPSIGQFTPGCETSNVPHEAIWSLEKVTAD